VPGYGNIPSRYEKQGKIRSLNRTGKFQIEKKTCILLTDVEVTERKRKEKKMSIHDLRR
jgi:hypothetical protein